jgi:hypothetical protein
VGSIRRVDPAASLAVLFPHVAQQWHPSRNTGVRVGPRQVSARSLLVVWWRCPDGHEWEQAIRERTDIRPLWKRQQAAACPYCAGHRQPAR